MTGTVVATLLALAWLYAALRFRRTPRWQGRTRILSGYAVHDIGPAQLRESLNPSAAVSPDAAVLITASAHGPATSAPRQAA